MKSHSLISWRDFKSDPVIGIDEVGRGCLAGPVYAAAVIYPRHLEDIKGLTDSKLLSESRREELSLEIYRNHQVGIGIASVEEIDKLNILQASFLAMQRAVNKLGVDQGHILVDGSFVIPHMSGFQQQAIVKGDLRCSLISAAAIVAKVARDEFMRKLSKEFSHYGFEKHKGYGTSDHRQAIENWGPSPWHRKSFKGVKEFLSWPTL